MRIAEATQLRALELLLRVRSWWARRCARMSFYASTRASE